MIRSAVLHVSTEHVTLHQPRPAAGITIRWDPDTQRWIVCRRTPTGTEVQAGTHESIGDADKRSRTICRYGMPRTLPCIGPSCRDDHVLTFVGQAGTPVTIDPRHVYRGLVEGQPVDWAWGNPTGRKVSWHASVKGEPVYDTDASDVVAASVDQWLIGGPDA